MYLISDDINLMYYEQTAWEQQPDLWCFILSWTLCLLLYVWKLIPFNYLNVHVARQTIGSNKHPWGVKNCQIIWNFIWSFELNICNLLLTLLWHRRIIKFAWFMIHFLCFGEKEIIFFLIWIFKKFQRILVMLTLRGWITPPLK